METSKKILLVSYIITGVLTAVTFIAAFVGLDVTPLTTITALAWGEVITSNAFYFNKAKKENTPKIARGCVEMSPEKAEKLARLMEVLGGIV